jgi:hypothetical protein
MAGKVVTSSREQIFTHLRKVQPILECLKGEKIIISPLPRYTHTACCESPDHCVGIDGETHAEDLVGGAIGIRKNIRDYLHCRVSKVWVPDVLELLIPGKPGISNIATGLKDLYAKDGVHLTVAGYKKLATSFHQMIMDKIAGLCSVSGGGTSASPPIKDRHSKSFYWKGFASPVGSTRPSNLASFHGNRAAVKSRHSGFHPYRKK